ncbi:MAG: DNA-binding response regulator, partial [Deltaproteobacteria bacterium HGW-Deltaproteobacteria-17]
LPRHRVTLDDAPLELTATEFALLGLFVAHPGWVFTRNQIIARVKGDDYPVTDRSVDVQVVGLRRKLGRLGECIETVRGVGYRIRENA